MVNAQLTGDLPQRPVRREDQLYGVLTELLGVVRGTGHLNILPQTTVWFQGVRSQGGTSDVAASLRYAADRINEVVAHEMSARVDRFQRIAERIETAVQELDPSYGSGPIDRLHDLVQSMDTEVERVEHALAPLQ